jgi:hypothetical protein
MAIWRRQFFHQATGDAGERTHFLACDTANGHVFIVSGYARTDQEYYETQSEIADFLTADTSAAKHALLQLIGMLVYREQTT